jgi:tRNA modification GTPase
MHSRDQTIFALSSGRPPNAISVVRVSGAHAGAILNSLAGRIPPPRMAARALIRDANQGPVDDAVVLWFPGPKSATGEDVAEFHVHGGRAVVTALFAALSSFENTRAAEPGEFTRRAFENGKLDLTEAEGLDDLIHADTERQRRQALRQLKGLLGAKARSWRAQIIEASALIEAGIDFSDEGDVPAELIAPALAKVKQLHDEIQEVLAAQGRSERLRDGLVVAIAGPPNVGKSTLMNQLARREVAIVSPHAGTTRDVIEVQLDLDGYPVTVIDTAGIRDTEDPVEQEGVRRARARAAEAPVWTVRNKIDLSVVRPHGMGQTGGSRYFEISAARGDGLKELMAALVAYAEKFFGSEEGGLIGRERQRTLLRETAASLQRSMSTPGGRGEELIAEDLRAAAMSLGRLLGRIDVEDILDKIFREFCVGK